MTDFPLLWRRNRVWLLLSALGITLSYGLPRWFVWSPMTSQLSAWFGLTLLILTLLPNNLLKLAFLQETIAARILTFFVRAKRNLGIAAGLLFVFHGGWALATFFQWQPAALLQKNIFLGAIVLGILILMLATSSKRASIALGPRWKLLHRLIWLALPLAFAHSLLSSEGSVGLSWQAQIGFGALLAYVVFENVYRLFRPSADKTPRIHLLLMLFGIALTLLIVNL